MTDFSPREIVSELDRHIIGQNDAKRAVAVALRNRWRRQQLEGSLREEVMPKNILMIGPTGVGKTEISRRLARLAGAPFIKVEATKFTEVGYVGRDVEQIIRERDGIGIGLVREKKREEVKAKAHQGAEDRVLDALVGKTASPATRETFRKRLRSGELDDKEIDVEVADTANPLGGMEIPGMPGANIGVLNLSDMLGDLFGNSRRGGPGPGTGPRRGDDLETELNLSFDEAVKGVTTSVHLTSDAACGTCKGSGSAPGSVPERCTQCEGRGVLDDDQGFFSLSQPCPRCSGRGRVVTNPCPTCRASGIERKPRQVKVRIPAGVKDGQRIRLKGRGSPGRNNGPTGDLYVIVKVGVHNLFARSGNNLTIDVPITFAEATLGANVKVPTLEGTSVTLKIPAATPTGKTFRVKGKGVHSTAKMGDLLVTVVIDVPSELSDEQRSAVEALAAATEKSPRQHLSGAS